MTQDSTEPAGGYSLAMPPERHVPLAVHEIVDSMRAHIKHNERSLFVDICKLLEGCSATEFMGIRARVKKNFRLFSAAALHRTLPGRKNRPMKKEDALDEQELVFLRDFFELMDIAHYDCLTQHDWNAALQERFMLDMPIRINWDHMDDRMLTRFFKRHPDLAHSLYEHHTRILVFHRGVGVMRKTDMFLMNKVDLLVKYLVAHPAKQVWYKVAPYVLSKDRLAAMHERRRRAEALANFCQTDSMTDAQRAEIGHKHAKKISRVSLRRLMPDYRSVFAKLFHTMEVVEPTYKDLVTLYRRKVDPPTMAELQKDASLGAKYRTEQRNIVIKRFDELPIADLEVLMPDKEVGLKLIDLLTLYGTAVGAVVGGVTAFFGASVELSVVLSTMGMMGGKLFQTYTQMQAKKANLMKAMSLKVYDISLDAQEGVLYSILDEMSDQYIKEMLLAYFLLWKHGQPVSQAELDDMCESYLEDKFDVKIDFAIEESLPRLLRDGLVMRDPDDPDRLVAAPLEKANLALQRKWSRAFLYDDSGEGSLQATMSASLSAVNGLGAAGLAGLSNLGKGVGNLFGASGRRDDDAASEISVAPSASGSKRRWLGLRKAKAH